MKYKVMVDDNFHYQDEEERYTLGEFDSLEAAIAACKKIVEEYLASAYKPGMTAEQLSSNYKMFGEDPWIAGGEGDIPFSAWKYAEQRSSEICQVSLSLKPVTPWTKLICRLRQGLNAGVRPEALKKK